MSYQQHHEPMGPKPDLNGQKESFASLPLWIRGEIDGFSIAILWLIQSYQPDAHPSIARLQKESGLSRAKIFKILAELEANGYLKRIPRKLENGSRTSSRYEMQIWNYEAPQNIKRSRRETEQADQAHGAADAPPAPPVYQVDPTLHQVDDPRLPGRRNLDLSNLETKPKSKEPPSIPPLGGSLPSVAGVGRLDVDESVSEQPRPRSGLQQPQEAAFGASSGHPCPPAPQNGLPGPQNGQQPQPAPLEQPAPQPAAQQKAPPKPKDPYSARHLPEHAVPNDLLPVQQLLREWWSVKARGRSEAAFNRACSLLRRHNRAEQEQILEKAVIGGYQGLHEPAPSASGRGPAAKPSLTQELRSMGLIQ